MNQNLTRQEWECRKVPTILSLIVICAAPVAIGKKYEHFTKTENA